MKLDRITSNPQRMNGQPCIRNLRLTVRRVIELLATYPNRDELRQEFPELEDEDIRQALILKSCQRSSVDTASPDAPASPEYRARERHCGRSTQSVGTINIWQALIFAVSCWGDRMIRLPDGYANHLIT